jgi:gluconate 2-dehydrogenase gamma chain
MDRREAIKRTALLMGGAVSASAIMGIMKGCTPKPTIDWKPSFLTEDQGLTVSTLAEIILPKTETAGAIDVGERMLFTRRTGNVYGSIQSV